jgi:hypothetical protein
LPQIWVRDLASGKDRQLTSHEQPLGAAWSPDGKRIAFLDTDGRWGVAGLEVVDVASGVVTRLQPSLAQPGKPTWSPMAAMWRPVKPFPPASAKGATRSGWCHPTARDALLARCGQGSLDSRGGGGPVWSPDGQKMAGIQDGVLKIWPVARWHSSGFPRAYTSEIALSDVERGREIGAVSGGGQAEDRQRRNGRDPRRAARLHLSLDIPKTKDRDRRRHGRCRPTTQTNKDIVIEGNRITAVCPMTRRIMPAPTR